MTGTISVYCHVLSCTIYYEACLCGRMLHAFLYVIIFELYIP